jgi:hypothetical protein
LAAAATVEGGRIVGPVRARKELGYRLRVAGNAAPIIERFLDAGDVVGQIAFEVPVGERTVEERLGDHPIAGVGEHVELRRWPGPLQGDCVEPRAVCPGAGTRDELVFRID